MASLLSPGRHQAAAESGPATAASPGPLRRHAHRAALAEEVAGAPVAVGVLAVAGALGAADALVVAGAPAVEGAPVVGAPVVAGALEAETARPDEVASSGRSSDPLPPPRRRRPLKQQLRPRRP